MFSCKDTVWKCHLKLWPAVFHDILLCSLDWVGVEFSPLLWLSHFPFYGSLTPWHLLPAGQNSKLAPRLANARHSQLWSFSAQMQMLQSWSRVIWGEGWWISSISLKSQNLLCKSRDCHWKALHLSFLPDRPWSQFAFKCCHLSNFQQMCYNQKRNRSRVVLQIPSDLN